MKNPNLTLEKNRNISYFTNIVKSIKLAFHLHKFILIILLFPMISFGQNVYIPDANFKNYLVTNSSINTNGDSEIQVSEASAFTDTINCNNLNISDLTGIEAFTALTYLFCTYNNLTSLEKDKLNQIAVRSIIKEKIKYLELIKYFKIDENTKEVDDIVLKEINKRLGINDLGNIKKHF